MSWLDAFFSNTSPTGTGLWYSVSGALAAAAITLSGDVSQGAQSGNNVPLTVTAIQGRAVSSSAPTNGQVLEWNSGASQWQPATGGTFTPGADLAGSTASNQWVQSISGNAGGGGTVALNITTLQWAKGQASPTISQATPTSDVATQNITISPQPPFAGAVTNVIGGNLIVNFAAPVSGQVGSFFAIQQAGTTIGSIFVRGDLGLGLAYTQYGKEVTPGGANWFFAGGSGQNFVNATAELGLGIAGGFGASVDIQTNGIQFFARTQALGGGVNVIGITNGTDPTSLPAGGIVLSASGQKLLIDANGIVFPAFITAPTISQPQSTTGAGHNASWTGQQAKTGSAGAGGNISLTAGAGDGAGATGAIQLQSGNGVGALSLQGVSGDILQLGATNVNCSYGPQLMQFGSSSSNPTIGIAAASAVPTSLSIVGQGAGGTNAGGNVNLQGGAHAGVQSDGHVFISTPAAFGELDFTPANGAQTLTNAQSNANCLNLLAGPTLAFTINLLRNQVGGSVIFVRNNTSQVATIAYLSGGTVTVAAGTSALIASNGSNLVKIMVGT